jgi:hypothetical protein
MIREERDPAFWARIASDPFCAPELKGHPPDIFGPLMETASCTPLATDHGGFLFIQIAPDVYDLHALYLPGHTRETSDGLALALERLKPDLCMVTQTDNPFSRPPLSFGFRKSGNTWFLTREAWASSPVRRRKCRSLSLH